MAQGVSVPDQIPKAWKSGFRAKKNHRKFQVRRASSPRRIWKKAEDDSTRNRRRSRIDRECVARLVSLESRPKSWNPKTATDGKATMPRRVFREGV